VASVIIVVILGFHSVIVCTNFTYKKIKLNTIIKKNIVYYLKNNTMPKKSTKSKRPSVKTKRKTSTRKQTLTSINMLRKMAGMKAITIVKPSQALKPRKSSKYKANTFKASTCGCGDY
jgi:hypothetical protein